MVINRNTIVFIILLASAKRVVIVNVTFCDEKDASSRHDSVKISAGESTKKILH